MKPPRPVIALDCANCGSRFERYFSAVSAALQSGKKLYCSAKCYGFSLKGKRQMWRDRFDEQQPYPSGK